MNAMPVHSRLSALLDWRFLGALTLLLCNDHWWKYAYPGLLTGKLSDFAGLYAYGFFWVAIWPRRRAFILLMIALGFVWWKSPISNSFIQVWSQIFYPIQRTIDYSDYLALLILLTVPNRFSYLQSSAIIRSSILCISWVAFAATSRTKTLQIRWVYQGNSTDAVLLLDSLAHHGLINMDVGKPDHESVRFLDEYVFRLRSCNNDTLFLFQIKDGLDSNRNTFSVQLQSIYDVSRDKLHVFSYVTHGDEANVMDDAQFKFEQRFKEIEPYFMEKGFTFVTSRPVHAPNGARY